MTAAKSDVGLSDRSTLGSTSRLKQLELAFALAAAVATGIFAVSATVIWLLSEPQADNGWVAALLQIPVVFLALISVGIAASRSRRRARRHALVAVTLLVYTTFSMLAPYVVTTLLVFLAAISAWVEQERSVSETTAAKSGVGLSDSSTLGSTSRLSRLDLAFALAAAVATGIFAVSATVFWLLSEPQADNGWVAALLQIPVVFLALISVGIAASRSRRRARRHALVAVTLLLYTTFSMLFPYLVTTLLVFLAAISAWVEQERSASA